MKKLMFILIASFVFVTGVGRSLAADPYQDTWIFRSPVTPGQSMWGPGTHTGYNMGDTYSYKAGIFEAGFEWNLQADKGTVFGNVEGNITAEYDKFVSQPGKTIINLSYAGIEDESQMGANFGVELSGQPYIKVDLPWPIPNVNLSLPIKMVDVDVDTKYDFLTGLDTTTSASGKYDIIPFNADLVLVSFAANLFLENDITFVPNTITGIMRYTHLATGTERQTPVSFLTDTDVLPLEADLDLPGAWEFSFEEFKVTENTFTKDLHLGLELSVGVPIVSAKLSLEIDLLGLPESNFPLDFLTHGYDGDEETVDRLGRFCLYVETPEPATLGLLLIGGLGLVSRRRKKS